MTKIDEKLYDYYRMAKIGPLTKFEDIEVGATYHIPPIIIYGRRDIIVEKKDWNTISGKMRHEDGTWTNSTLYRTELSMRYLIKRKHITKLY